MSSDSGVDFAVSYDAASLLARPWLMLQNATGAANDQIAIGIQEISPSRAMEMGQIMPEVA